MVSKKSRRLQEILARKPAILNYPWRFLNKNRNLRQEAHRHPAASRVAEGCRPPLAGMPQRRFRSLSDAMLQTVQEKYPGRKVSSLYCVWTTRDGSPNSPLIGLWIEPSMGSFEGEFALAAESDSTKLSAEAPGIKFAMRVEWKPELVQGLESLTR
jgi:hypothetical protein